MRAIHIQSQSADETAAVIAAELERGGQACSWGDDIPPGAEYVLTPTGRRGGAQPAEIAGRIIAGLGAARAAKARHYEARDFVFSDFWGDVPEEMRAGREETRRQEEGEPEYTKRDTQVEYMKDSGYLFQAHSLAAHCKEATAADRHRTVSIAVAISVHPPYLRWLPTAVASVEAQTFVPVEKWLLCDGCEPPGDLPPGWKTVTGMWKHPGPGRNAMLRQTGAAWVEWLDADDAFAPGHLEAVAGCLSGVDATVGMVYPDLAFFDAELLVKVDDLQVPEWNRDLLRGGNFVPTPSAWNVQMLKDMDGWPEKVIQLDDWAAAMEGSRRGWSGRHVKGTPVRVRRHVDSMGRQDDRREQAWWQTRRLSAVTLFSGISELLPQWQEWLSRTELPPYTTVIAGDNSGDPAFGEALRTALAGLPVASTMYVRTPSGMDIETGINGPHSRVPGLYNQIMPQACELGDLVLMLEDDVLPPADAVRKLSACFPTSEPTRKVGGVAGIYQSRGGGGILAISRDPYNWRAGVTVKDILPGMQPIGLIPGGCSLFDARALRSCLPFRWTVDPNGERVGWDGNVCRRLNRDGWKLFYHGDVRCEHHVSWQRYHGRRTIEVLRIPDSESSAAQAAER